MKKQSEKDIFLTFPYVFSEEVLMEGFLKRLFENGYKKAVAEIAASSSSVDLVKLREEIGKVNGIGAKRLDEVMEVIIKCL